MPKLPTASDYQYGGAQATRGISSVNMSQAGAGAEALGKSLTAYADVEKERQSKSELAVARNEFLRQELATRSQIEQSEKYGEYEQNYGKGVAEARNKALMMVGDDAVREQLATEFDGDIIRGQYQMRQAAFRKRQEFDKANVLNIGDETLKSVMETDDLSTRNRLLQSMNEAIDSSIGFDPVRKQALKKQYNEDAAEMIIGQMPADKKLALATGASKSVAPKTFEETLPLLHKVEGGHNPDDGASKAPALYGINRKHHPEKFDEVYALREAGREGEAIAVANQFYKEEFWDKNNIDELPEDTRAIVFDAFVNQGNFGKKLYAAAENGATAGQLLEARRAKYNRLAESPEYAPSHGGWMKRIATVADATGVNPEGSDLFRMLSPEKQAKIRQDAEIEVRAIQDRERVASALRGETYIDSSDKDQMKTYDSYFRDVLLPETEGMDIYERNAFIVGQVANAGVMPKSLKADMEGKLRTGSDEEVIAASDLYLQMQTVAPELTASVSEKNLAVAVQVSESIASGIPPKEAVQMARLDLEIENKPLYQTRKEYLKQDDVRTSVQKEAEGFFSSWIPFVGQDVDVNSQQGAALIADYKKSYNDMYLRSGSEDIAKSFAERIVNGRYSQTEFNGGTIMQYSPERYYSVPRKDNAWITEDFSAWRKKVSPSIAEGDEDNYYIQPDMRTAREASAVGSDGEPPQPTYKVVYMNKETGMFDVLEQRYKPNKKAAIAGNYDEAIEMRKKYIEAEKSKASYGGGYIKEGTGVYP